MEPTSTTATADGKQDGQRFYHAQPNSYQLIFTLSSDEMECVGHLDISEGGTAPSQAEILAFLAADGITTGIIPQAIEQLQGEARPGHSTTCTIAVGTPPVPGEDGRLDYSICSLEPPPQTATDDDDSAAQKVDFHTVQRFINVDPDQQIGRIVPPTNGSPGTTVRAKPVPPPPGKPLQIKLGKNVHLASEDANTLVSEIHGRVKLDGETIQVVEEYVVDGDVDFTVGNIRFNGFVEVHGDVLDGFQINATKGLKITGNVGSCQLISLGNIELCGMDGQSKGSIHCGGSISANFIHECSIECSGPIEVHVELLNCSVRCRNTVHAGIISGGSCIALGGVDAKKLGAPSGVKTKLHTGADYHDLQRLEELFTQLSGTLEAISKTNGMDEMNRLLAEKQRLTTAIVEVRHRRPAGSNPKVNVRGRLYEGVTVQVGNSVEEFSTQHEGPFSLIENSVEGGIRQVTLSELALPAVEAERSYLEEQQRKFAEEAEAAERAAAEELAATDNTADTTPDGISDSTTAKPATSTAEPNDAG